MTTTVKRAFHAVALMAAYGITPSQCFGPESVIAAFGMRTTATIDKPNSSSSSSSYLPHSSTRCFFRATADTSSPFRTTSADLSSIITNNAINSPNLSSTAIADPPQPQPQPYSQSPIASFAGTAGTGMPTWLSSPKAHLSYTNIESLRNAMKDSFFTENEISKLNFAIQEAAGGDANKASGAAEFCLILVETMEMGLNALIAAAFHFCACVGAREQSLLPQFQGPHESSAWELRQHPVVASSFGKHVSDIERDLARLKRLEIVAAMVVRTSGVQSHRAFPDVNDASNLRNLFLTESKDWRSLAIRSAACLYRLRGIADSSTTERSSNGRPRLTREAVRVSREALHIYAPLASRLGMHRLKNELEYAAFKILYRRQYETVSSGSRDGQSRRRSHIGQGEGVGERMNQVLLTVQAEMTEMLENDPVFSASVDDFTVTARVKEAYSTWIKMLRIRAKNILDVPDAIALRIVLNGKKKTPDEDPSVTEARERALCYYAQKLCTERWLPLKENPRFKDYIESPKPNGYQSLHYTASTLWDGEEWTLEIQVRSGKMHQVAEFGLASHWDYKARSKTTSTTGKKSFSSLSSSSSKTVTISDTHSGKEIIGSSGAYLQTLQEWHWRQQGGARQEESRKPTVPELLVSSDCAESQVRAARIRSRTQRLAPYIEALAETQSGLTRDHVFVFLTGTGDANDGKILTLPAGAMVMDAIREYQHGSGIRNISLDETTVTVNGLSADLSSTLRNGDILSVSSSPPVATA